MDSKNVMQVKQLFKPSPLPLKWSEHEEGSGGGDGRDGGGLQA